MTNEIVDLLSELVGHPTISNRPVDAISESLASRAEDAGGTVECVESEPGKHNVIARFGPNDQDGLIISGHMDVVPVEGQPWTSDPFKLTNRDGVLYGRGTADMKGFIAAITVALKSVPLSDLTRELVLVWTHDEEVGFGPGPRKTSLSPELRARSLQHRRNQAPGPPVRIQQDNHRDCGHN